MERLVSVEGQGGIIGSVKLLLCVGSNLWYSLPGKGNKGGLVWLFRAGNGKVCHFRRGKFVIFVYKQGGEIEPGLVVCEVLVYINGWYEKVLLWGKRFIGEKH